MKSFRLQVLLILTQLGRGAQGESWAWGKGNTTIVRNLEYSDPELKGKCPKSLIYIQPSRRKNSAYSETQECKVPGDRLQTVSGWLMITSILSTFLTTGSLASLNSIFSYFVWQSYRQFDQQEILPFLLQNSEGHCGGSNMIGAAKLERLLHWHMVLMQLGFCINTGPRRLTVESPCNNSQQLLSIWALNETLSSSPRGEKNCWFSLSIIFLVYKIVTSPVSLWEVGVIVAHLLETGNSGAKGEVFWICFTTTREKKVMKEKLKSSRHPGEIYERCNKRNEDVCATRLYKICNFNPLSSLSFHAA